jgi:hypothetical protein
MLCIRAYSNDCDCEWPSAASQSTSDTYAASVCYQAVIKLVLAMKRKLCYGGATGLR